MSEAEILAMVVTNEDVLFHWDLLTGTLAKETVLLLYGIVIFVRICNSVVINRFSCSSFFSEVAQYQLLALSDWCQRTSSSSWNYSSLHLELKMPAIVRHR